MINLLKKNLLLAIPVLYLAWSLQLSLLGGSFSMSRSDPEYPYLLNGLNCATLQFSNIGHTDHPGTPFQMLTGIFIRVTHLIAGQGPITSDVLARPEMYLSTASFYLSVITFFLLLWLGRTGIRSKGGLSGAMLLQSSFLLSSVLIDIPLRYNPDRILVIYNLLLAGITLRFLFSDDFPARRYAIVAGIITGIGFATKFNFLPVLIIPFLVIPDYRNRAWYSLSVLGAFIAGILPILGKFKDFRNFISGVVTHDGLYGGGSEKVINLNSFFHNFIELLVRNPAFLIVLLISVGIMLFYLFNRKKKPADPRLLALTEGFLLASIIGFILVSKHFKVYYFAPVLSLSALVLFTSWMVTGKELFRGKYQSYILPALTIVLVLISVMPLPAQYKSRLTQKHAVEKTARFYAGNVTRNDLIFVEPTWLSGPFTENALAYGISYVAHRHEFYSEYQALYPNILTWEGAGKIPGLFRTAKADPESILFSGRDIYIFSSPGRNPGMLLKYLDSLSGAVGTVIRKDTVFSNPGNDDRVIRVRNGEGWKTLTSIKKVTDQMTLTAKGPVTEPDQLTDVIAGDYIEITVQILNNDKDAAGRIVARSPESDKDGIYFEDAGSLQDIGNGWQLLRLRGKIGATPPSGRMLCQVYYPGNREITIRDLEIRHMGRR
jgi:hypothetical protein